MNSEYQTPPSRPSDMVLGKKVAIFDWEWGRNSAPRDGQKRPCQLSIHTSALNGLNYILN